MVRLVGALEGPGISPPTRRSLLRGVIAFRIIVGVWMTLVFVWETWERSGNDPDGLKPDVAHPAVGLMLLAAAWLIIAVIGVSYARDADAVLSPTIIVPEIAIGATLLLADTWVYGSTHSQALPTVWPLASIFTVAIAAGARPAVITGIGLGLARYAGWLAFPYEDGTRWSLARVASTVLFAVAGWVAGYLLNSQAAADRSISAYRAREEVARTLHDGVLQTLAVIQRRTEDPELVTLARTQELELRDFLFGGSEVAADLATSLRAAARRAEARYPIRVDVVCAPDLPAGLEHQIHAITGAVNEALTNAAKHGRSPTATVYAEPGEVATFFVSVKDRGVGFDPRLVQTGEGLARSIRGRIDDAGGTVEISSQPGRGAEVRLHV